MLSSSDFGPTPGDAVIPRGTGASAPHTELLAEALRQWFGVAVRKVHSGQRADLVFREAIDMACARAPGRMGFPSSASSWPFGPASPGRSRYSRPTSRVRWSTRSSPTASSGSIVFAKSFRSIRAMSENRRVQNDGPWDPAASGIAPGAFTTISGEFRRLLVEDRAVSSPTWRRSFAEMISFARRHRLQPEHILIALKTEWHRVVGFPRRPEDQIQLGRLVSLTIESYYSIDGDGKAADGDGNGDADGHGAKRM